jgi:nucleoid-associated protein YgaU
MGLFSFIKEAGEKIFGEDKPEPKQAPAAGAGRGEGLPPEVLRVRALHRQVEATGIPVENLEIRCSGDTAHVSGRVRTQADKEKLVLVVGNARGIAQVDEDLEVEHPEPEATFYTVVSGDSLSKIAKKHYGDASKYPVIFEANRPMLQDPDKIYPGQVLRIPPAAA